MRRWFVGVVVLVAALVAVDRLSVWAAQRDVAKRLQADAHLRTAPGVTIHGFPFLTQLIGGDINDVDVDVRGMVAGSLRIASLRVHVRDARVSIADVLSQTASRIHVARASAELLLTYPDIARALPPGAPSGQRVDHVLIRGASVTGGDALTLHTTYGDVLLRLPSLPFGIRLTTAKATQAGIVVDGSARGLVLQT